MQKGYDYCSPAKVSMCLLTYTGSAYEDFRNNLVLHLCFCRMPVVASSDARGWRRARATKVSSHIPAEFAGTATGADPSIAIGTSRAEANVGRNSARAHARRQAGSSSDRTECGLPYRRDTQAGLG